MRHLTYGEAVPVTVAGTAVRHARALCGDVVRPELADMVPLNGRIRPSTCPACADAARTHTTPGWWRS